MQKFTKPLLMTALAAACTAALAAPPAVSNFNSGLDGWSSASAAADISWSANGGNTGGYLRFEDVTAGLALIDAPAAFLGNWSALNGTGAITYDHRLFDPRSPINFGPYGVRLSGPGGAATWTGATPTGATGWVNQNAPLNAAAWSVTSGTWNGLLSNVTSFQIVIELAGNAVFPGDITGIDNVGVVPEPETYAMLGLGLGVLGLARMRRRRSSAFRLS